MNEVRQWTPDELSNVLSKVAGMKENLKIIDDALSFDSLLASLRKVALEPTLSSMISQARQGCYVKAPLELMQASVMQKAALCVNREGEWSLRKDGYMALSHVWEEGIQADPQNLGLPRYILDQIFKIIEPVGATWLWLDGLAIAGGNRTLSSGEEALKIDIINTLASVYERAEAVIVFDAIVLRLHSTDPVDIAVALSCGKWRTRIWTYQEAKLATKVLLLTASGIADFQDVLKELCRRHELSVTIGGRDSEKLLVLKNSMLGLIRSDSEITLSAISKACYGRRTGNDIDYARAFFPLLKLHWQSRFSREEATQVIYESQYQDATRLICLHGSPRLKEGYGWAPSYLNDVEGDLMDNLNFQKRGIYAEWITYKIQESIPAVSGAYVFRIGLTSGRSFLCGGTLSRDEHEESIRGFNSACADGTAYILTRRIIYPKPQWATPVLLVRKLARSHGVQEAFVYMTLAVGDSEAHERPGPEFWLLLHDNPIRTISTHSAAGEGMAEIRYMLSDEARHRGDTAVHVAAQVGDTVGLSQLTKDRSTTSLRNNNGWTALHVAAYYGHEKAVKLLIEAGSFVDALENRKRTPLILAADEGQFQAAKVLLESGADAKYSDPDQWSALFEAIIRKHTDVVKLLLSKGVDPNASDKFNLATPLGAAVERFDILSSLLEAGADANLQHSTGLSPLHMAARAGARDSAEKLLFYNADVDVAIGPGDPITPLYYAIEQQHEEVVHLLLFCGADANKRFQDAWTPLMFAAKAGNLSICRQLLDAGAELSAISQAEAWTPLHIGARYGRRVVVKLLCERGASNGKETEDRAGKTPLQLAQENGHQSVIQYLQEQ
ncbi:MAG: hypothetical protein Q9191_000147 [Dirinaria sp. TL-2023a]